MNRSVEVRCAIAAAVLLLAGCTQSSRAREALEAQGFRDVQITGYRWFGCSKDDTFHTGFTAKAPTGKQVGGVVCSDFFKGATIRYD